MIGRVSWFSRIDYPIWEFFEAYDIRVSPKVLARNIEYDPGYVGRRLRKMRDAGLLVQHDDGLYEPSDLGKQLIDGDLSREEIEALDPDYESG
jgi:hypothetical protein